MSKKQSKLKAGYALVMSLGDIKPNGNNPREIKQDKFEKLVKSLHEFPEMTKVRPIIVNTDGEILGGNMRYQAMIKAGWKEAYVQVVDWSEEKQREFLIKDNANFGQWDIDELANEWDEQQLNDWGLDISFPAFEEEPEEEDPEIEFSEVLDESMNYVVLTFDNDLDWLAAQTHFGIGSKYSKRANGKPWSKGVGRVIKGAEYLDKINKRKK